MISWKHSTVLAALLLAFTSASLRAQENYEIQVYPSETMARLYHQHLRESRRKVAGP